MEDIYYPSADGKHTVHAVIWRPECKVRAVLQIIHGMEEYASRYSPFAERAAKEGILVCAEDHLGHGLTAPEKNRGHFPENGEELVLEDIRSLTLRVIEMAPEVPFFIMGHSMGSFFCREYISRYGGGLSGAIIMGTGYKDKVTLMFARLMSSLIGGIKGKRYKSPLIGKLAFGAYNKRFAPARTSYDWLSSDNGNVDGYIADELCGFGFTCGGYSGLFGIISKACSARAFEDTPKNLPLLIVAGTDDPVGDYGKGVEKTYSKYIKAGVKDARLKLYTGARHEILNDFCKEAVCRDVISFIKEKCGSAREETL